MAKKPVLLRLCRKLLVSARGTNFAFALARFLSGKHKKGYDLSLAGSCACKWRLKKGLPEHWQPRLVIET